MSNPLPSTVDFHLSPARDPNGAPDTDGPWRLPGSWSHFELIERRRPGVWSARSDNDALAEISPMIVELLDTAPAGMPALKEWHEVQPGVRRFAIDLTASSGTLPPPANNAQVAVVTLLPINLPEPYQDLELVDFVNAGGQGSVWAGHWSELPGLKLAIKFFSPRIANDWTKLPQFLEETKAGLEITHPNIVHSRRFLNLSHCPEAGWPAAAFVMENRGLSLHQLIRQCREGKVQLSQHVVIDFCRHMISALEELHLNQRLVHRDVKSGNVMIKLRDNAATFDPSLLPDVLTGAVAQISDLGTVCPAGSVPSVFLGHDHYKAPELFVRDSAGQFVRDVDGRPQPDFHRAADPAEDMYAFGEILHELAAVVEGDPAWLRNIADRLTDVDPAKRLTADHELIHLLSPDWSLQEKMVRELGGYAANQHLDFVGREFVFSAFDEYRASCVDHGGMFLIEGDAGIGKSALLTNWMRRGAPHLGYFYRYSEGRTVPSEMPRALILQIAQRYGVEPKLPDHENQYPQRLRELLDQVSREKLTPGEMLLICVDGLDEASNPERAVQMLPKPPFPRGVFFIVASRPAAAKVDHLDPLTLAGARKFALHGDDQQNLADAAAFLCKKLNGNITEAESHAVAKSAGGIFLLLRYWVEDILAGKLTVAQTIHRPAGWYELPANQRLMAWYRESWQRITQNMPEQEQGWLTRFACLMSAVRAPYAEKESLNVLSWQGSRLDWARNHLAWLLTRTVEEHQGYKDGYLRLRHQSVNDFLVSHDYEGPARHDIDGMNSHIGTHYVTAAEKNTWYRIAPYGRRFAVRHLLLANTEELAERAINCLTDPRYLSGTIGDVSPEAFGVAE